ncbi:MAG: competence protein ComEC [Hyphomicrobiales bacterium]|nr:competence protein ComEC [Hyphomicrobiales bacterium]
MRPVLSDVLQGAPGWSLGLWRARPGPQPVGWRTALAGALSAMLSQEVRERRLFLWLPVFFLAGILAYFAAAQEPSPVAPLVAMALFAAVHVWSGRRGAIGFSRLSLVLAFVFAGFSAGVLRTASMAAPALAAIKVAKVTAFVETVDPRKSGGRLLLRVGAIEGLAADATPSRLRVTVRTLDGVRAGAFIRATMRLVPPAEPSEPGGYDFSREAFYMGIGGVGSVVSRVEDAPAFDVSAIARLNAAIDRARNDLTARIATAIGGDDGAVAAALVTGKRGLIGEGANDVLRGAGIYHVVSISGLHMVLAAGLFMWSLRALLALSPAIALYWPVKKISALFAMLGATAYCIFAGSEVATERSLVMIIVMLGAVLCDRPALSMRNLAIAALLVMAREPESVMGPSFQMSFSAVAAMIALFERGPQAEPGERGQGWWARVARALAVMLLTTFVAGVATGAYASFHFHRINPYSLIGNSLTLPLVEFVVMPMALLGVVTGPFGLDGPVWSIMGYGITGMMEVSRHVAGIAGSTRYVEGFGVGALLTISLGLMWLTLWRSAIRYAGIPVALAGLLMAQAARPPDLAVDAAARSLAVRGFSGRFAVLNGKGNDFAVSQWLLGDADSRKPGAPELAGEGRCDASGCVTRLIDGRTVALVLTPAALAEDCQRADIVVTRLHVFGRCTGPELVLDGEHFAARGATELRLAPDGSLALRTARIETIDRPWSPRRTPRFARAPRREERDARDPYEAREEDGDMRAFAAE